MEEKYPKEKFPTMEEVFDVMDRTFGVMANEDPIVSYAERRVGQNQFKWGTVSTAIVRDGKKPYETAVHHRDYYDGKIIVVEAYQTIGEAEKGHDKWCLLMDTNPPDVLTDCCNSEISRMLRSIAGPEVVVHKRKIRWWKRLLRAVKCPGW